ncbi:hypothetical protein [Collimonas pratensis]|uniref:MORN repeat family protein n=1 Tax=Collimonas pratensis TaxID=279113 RepID=A0ABM5Z1A3_9BURK|nr:hypothetical protein [Collimonas pratensis]AMP12731.1 MORN repeat family protein [Collimonas pratensis]
MALAALQFSGAGQAANIPAVAATVNPAAPGAAQKPDEPPRRWAFDVNNGCKVWSAEPLAGSIAVLWSGRCLNDLAQGPGTVRWLSSGKQVAELSGTMEQGKLRGHVTGVEEPGNRFDGMYIDSLPEGPGKAFFADGSAYDGQWHRGHQLGYGIMTFPPSHPQYQDMLKNGRGTRTENGMYVLRGWWEGKNFITACNSEEECEKAVVVLMKLDQDAAAARASAAAQTAPAIAPVTPPTPAVEPAAVAPAAAEPVPQPAAAMPAAVIPAAEPVIIPAPVASPETPVMDPAAIAPQPTAVEAPPDPAAAMPAGVAAPAPAPEPAPVPATEPALTPAAEPAPLVSPPATPVEIPPIAPEPANAPMTPAPPEPEPAASPKALTPAPGSTDTALGGSEPISISNGSS